MDRNDDLTTPTSDVTTLTSTKDTVLSSTSQHGTSPASTTPGLPLPCSGFKLKWLEERSWLHYVSQQYLKRCDICHHHQTKIRSLQQHCGPKFCDSVATSLTSWTNWRTSTLNDHDAPVMPWHQQPRWESNLD